MHQTSALYKQLLRLPHYTEHKLVINGVDYAEDDLHALDTSGSVIPGSTLQVGACPSRTVKATIVDRGLTIPRMATLEPMSRLTDGERVSEWIPKGRYYIDTRDPNAPPGQLTFTGYDDMLKADVPYPGSKLSWPAADIDVVREIAKNLGVSLDSRTTALMTNRYPVKFPAQYTMRETLGYIAAMYAGCFVMSDLAQLRLITLYSLPEEPHYLVTEAGDPITIGGVRILV